MEVFHWLPKELKFEVLIHLDCRTLVRILNVYQSLQNNVVIISASPKQWLFAETRKPSISTLLPGVPCVSLESMPSSLPPHSYLKIFELGSDLRRSRISHRRFFDKFTPCHGVGTDNDCEATIYKAVWPKLLALMDNYSVLSCATDGDGFGLVKGWLLQMSWITGASYHPLPLAFDDTPGTLLPRRQARSAMSHLSTWSRLTSIKVTVEKVFQIERAPPLQTLSVEFTMRGRASAPVLRINSAPSLRKLRVVYHGELVPWLTLKGCFLPSCSTSRIPSYSPSMRKAGLYYSPKTRFEMTRLHPKESLSPVSLATTSMEKDSYKGDLSFLKYVPSISFSGIPDWFVLTPSYSRLVVFRWYRTDPSKVESVAGAAPALYLPLLRDIHICSMIKNDSIPLISNFRTGKERYRISVLDVFDLTVGAPGLKLNGFLPHKCLIRDLVIRSYPSRTSTSALSPALSLDIDELKGVTIHHFVLLGDIDFSGILSREPFDPLLSPEAPLLAFDSADIDLGTTARHCPNNRVDLQFLLLGNNFTTSVVRITCPPKQPLVLALYMRWRSSHFSQGLTRVQSGDDMGRYIPLSNRKLFLDWHIVHSTTIEGEPVVSADFRHLPEFSKLPYAHFLFDGISKKYVFCEICTECIELVLSKTQKDP